MKFTPKKNTPYTVLAKQEITLKNKVAILNEKLYFSSDGDYVFILLLDVFDDSFLEVVTFDS